MTLPELRAQSLADYDCSVPQGPAKKAAGLAALDLVKDGMVVGLGTGSTVAYFLEGLRDRVRQGLRVTGVATSEATAQIARDFGIQLVSNGDTGVLENDLCVDGADRVDDEAHLIKGGGGALLREKLVAVHSCHRCIMVDPSKLVPRFDASFPLPVECFSFGIQSTLVRLAELGCEVSIRKVEGDVFVTDNHNLIVDGVFSSIEDPEALEVQLRSLVGVAETGLFCGMADTVIVGRNDDKVFSWSR